MVPAFAMSFVAHGLRTVSIAAVLAALTALAPFGLPNVSLAHYVDCLLLSARNGVNAGRLRQNAEWLFYLGLPVALVLWSVRRTTGISPHLRAVVLTSVPAI